MPYYSTFRTRYWGDFSRDGDYGVLECEGWVVSSANHLEVTLCGRRVENDRQQMSLEHPALATRMTQARKAEVLKAVMEHLSHMHKLMTKLLHRYKNKKNVFTS